MQTKIFITCKGLNLAKTTFVHDKGYKSLGVSNLEKKNNQTTLWESSNQVGVNFEGKNYATAGINFAST